MDRSDIDAPLVRLVDDNPGMLESLAFVLRCEGYETAAYESAEAFLRADRPSRPGCLMLDVKMPKLSGIELQEILNARRSRLPIIFLTAHGNIDMAVDAMHEGALDFQQKPVDPQKLLDAVARAVAQEMRRSRAAAVSEGEASLDSLSPREWQVIEMVAEGLTSREIAEKTGISRRTAEHQRASGMKKLGARSPAELAVLLAGLHGRERA